MAYEFTRNLKDKNYSSTVAVAQGGSSALIFDLEQIRGGDIEGIQVQVLSPAIAGLTDGKVLSFLCKDSADGTTFTAFNPAITSTVTAAGGVGVPATEFRFRLPPNCRRYIVVEQALTATAGTITGNYTVNLVF